MDQDAASLQPVWTYTDDNSSILYPDMSVEHDIYGIPNVVEVYYSGSHDNYFARVVNDDPNSPIPCILAVIGAVLNGVVSGFSVESIVYGAVMGLASTGLHQAFTQFIEGKNNISTEEDDADGVHDHQ